MGLGCTQEVAAECAANERQAMEQRRLDEATSLLQADWRGATQPSHRRLVADATPQPDPPEPGSPASELGAEDADAALRGVHARLFPSRKGEQILIT
jgi:hypothetical protein